MYWQNKQTNKKAKILNWTELCLNWPSIFPNVSFLICKTVIMTAGQGWIILRTGGRVLMLTYYTCMCSNTL